MLNSHLDLEPVDPEIFYCCANFVETVLLISHIGLKLYTMTFDVFVQSKSVLFLYLFTSLDLGAWIYYRVARNDLKIVLEYVASLNVFSIANVNIFFGAIAIGSDRIWRSALHIFS